MQSRRNTAIRSFLTTIITCSGLAAFAQDAQPCETNFLPGLVFTGYQAVITAPVDFAHATEATSALYLFPDIRQGNSLLALIAPTSETFEAEITFRSHDNTPLYVCTIAATPFAGQLDLTTTGFGDCELEHVDGPQELSARSPRQTLQTPSPVNEIVAFPADILGALPVSDRQIQIAGIAAGVGHIGWLGEDTGNGTLKGVCPIRVGPSP